jgi:hypothetical protein
MTEMLAPDLPILKERFKDDWHSGLNPAWATAKAQT